MNIFLRNIFSATYKILKYSSTNSFVQANFLLQSKNEYNFKNISSLNFSNYVLPKHVHSRSCSKACNFCSSPPNQDDYENKEVVNVTIIDRDANKIHIRGKIGENILDLAQLHKVDLEGACEGSIECCTCHVYINKEYVDKLPKATDEEKDMLDLALALRDNSRLGCQVILTKDLDGITVQLPIGEEGTND